MIPNLNIQIRNFNTEEAKQIADSISAIVDVTDWEIMEDTLVILGNCYDNNIKSIKIAIMEVVNYNCSISISLTKYEDDIVYA